LQLNSDGKDEDSSDDDYLGYEQVWDKEGPPIHPPGRGLPPGPPRKKFTTDIMTANLQIINKSIYQKTCVSDPIFVLWNNKICLKRLNFEKRQIL
jgi:hypothetical protein